MSLNVLVVDDSSVIRAMIIKTLGLSGIELGEVHQAANGREALDLLTKRPRDFDLMLLDMDMPELDGIATIAAVRAGAAGPGTQDIWTIALSADVREQQRQQAMKAGLNDYLTKEQQRWTSATFTFTRADGTYDVKYDYTPFKPKPAHSAAAGRSGDDAFALAVAA